ncbi:MAG: hypothetical protein MMC23_001237 [Stictis urceolatum]|nr:hypothetical protein [Stictis urceolata]
MAVQPAASSSSGGEIVIPLPSWLSAQISAAKRSSDPATSPATPTLADIASTEELMGNSTSTAYSPSSTFQSSTRNSISGTQISAASNSQAIVSNTSAKPTASVPSKKLTATVPTPTTASNAPATSLAPASPGPGPVVIALAAVLGSIAFISLLWLGFWCLRRRRKKREASPKINRGHERGIGTSLTGSDVDAASTTAVRSQPTMSVRPSAEDDLSPPRKTAPPVPAPPAFSQRPYLPPGENVVAPTGYKPNTIVVDGILSDGDGAPGRAVVPSSSKRVVLPSTLRPQRKMTPEEGNAKHTLYPNGAAYPMHIPNVKELTPPSPALPQYPGYPARSATAQTPPYQAPPRVPLARSATTDPRGLAAPDPRGTDMSGSGLSDLDNEVIRRKGMNEAALAHYQGRIAKGCNTYQALRSGSVVGTNSRLSNDQQFQGTEASDMTDTSASAIEMSNLPPYPDFDRNRDQQATPRPRRAPAPTRTRSRSPTPIHSPPRTDSIRGRPGFSPQFPATRSDSSLRSRGSRREDVRPGSRSQRHRDRESLERAREPGWSPNQAAMSLDCSGGGQAGACPRMHGGPAVGSGSPGGLPVVPEARGGSAGGSNGGGGETAEVGGAESQGSLGRGGTEVEGEMEGNGGSPVLGMEDSSFRVLHAGRGVGGEF